MSAADQGGGSDHQDTVRKERLRSRGLAIGDNRSWDRPRAPPVEQLLVQQPVADLVTIERDQQESAERRRCQRQDQDCREGQSPLQRSCADPRLPGRFLHAAETKLS